MADCAPVMIWMSGTDALCDWFNQPWLDFTGRTMDQEMGNGWAEGVHPEDFQRCLDIYIGAFQARQAFRMEYRLRRKDGDFRWILDSGAPRFNADGSFAGFIGSCIDIHDSKEIEEELRRARAELEDRVLERTQQLRLANQELESFSYAVSHDLRGPLRSISGFSQILLRTQADRLDEQGRDHLKRISASALRMNDLIEALLDLGRLFRSELRREPVDLSAFAHEIADELRQRDPARRVEFSIQPALSAEGDPRLVRIALENLIGNAWKFTATRAEGRIAIESLTEDGYVYFAVRDNGVGFDMEQAERMFVAFQRLHDPQVFPGTGIGLATVQRIINRHGGRLRAEGVEGRGASFLFSLG